MTRQPHQPEHSEHVLQEEEDQTPNSQRWPGGCGEVEDGRISSHLGKKQFLS